MGRRRERLYTTAVQAKQALNGGVLPRLTPLTDEAKRVVDEAIVPGMGVIRECGAEPFEGKCLECGGEWAGYSECKELGLQCPVCGVWKHSLRRHLNTAHADKGGAKGILRALSIPTDVPLISRSVSERMREANAGKRRGSRATPAQRAALEKGRKAPRGKPQPRPAPTAAERNFRNDCEAQIGQQMLNMWQFLGREPTETDAEKLEEMRLLHAARRLYGSWKAAWDTTAAKANLGTRREAVISQLVAYYQAHGRFPNTKEARSPTRAPLVPTPAVAKREVGVGRWSDVLAIARRRIEAAA